jgi:hypothetical protein
MKYESLIIFSSDQPDYFTVEINLTYLLFYEYQLRILFLSICHYEELKKLFCSLWKGDLLLQAILLPHFSDFFWLSS